MNKDIHNGGRCFIVGNGQSLNDTNLMFFRNEVLIGVDDAYMCGLDYDYYMVYDLKNWKKNYQYVLELNTKLFISHKIYEDYQYMQPRYPRYCRGDLQIVRIEGVNNSVEMGIVLVKHLEFKTVFLIGCENYSHNHQFDMGFDVVVLDGKNLEDELYTYTSPKCQVCDSKTKYKSALGRIFSECMECGFVSVIENR